MKHALMLEDDPVRGGRIVAALERNNYDVVWARTVSEAMLAWENKRFDIALLDHDLGQPNNGCHFVRWVSCQPDQGTKFIVHSGNIVEAPKTVQTLYRAGLEVVRVWPDEAPAYIDAYLK